MLLFQSKQTFIQKNIKCLMYFYVETKNKNALETFNKFYLSSVTLDEQFVKLSLNT